MKGSKFGKRVISLLLAALMTFGVFCATPISVSAEETDPQENASVSNVNDDMKISGTNSFGNMVANAIGDTTEQQEQNGGYNVFSVEVSGKTATVSLETLQDAALIVAIYEDDGEKMLASGTANISAGDKTASVTIDIKTMPQYFYLKAYIVDAETLRPLCTAFSCPTYTKEVQDLLAMSTDDFNSEKVLNFDNDKKNNFAVYDDNTKIIESNGASNRVVSANDDTRTYVIKNADSSVSSLKSGDIFSCDLGDGNILIVKVAQITMNGSTATIKGQETNLDEVFEYVKIDSDADLSNADIDPSSCDEGVTYEGLVNEVNNPTAKNYSAPFNAESNNNGKNPPAPSGVEAEGKTKASMKFNLAKFGNDKGDGDGFKFKISGDVEIGIEASIKLYITWSQQYLETKLGYEAKIALSLSLKGTKSIPLAEIGISPIPGVYIGFTPSIELEANAEIELSGTLEGSIGFQISIQNGINNISKSPTFKPEIKVEGKFFIGFSLKPKIKVLGVVAEVSMKGKVGAEIKATMTYAPAGGEETHECKHCIDGDISAKIELSFEAKFLNSDRLKLQYKMLDFTAKLFDFYYSFDFNEFAFTSCPHHKYLVDVKVVDNNDKPVSGATVNGSYTTDKNGRTSFYMNNGKFTVNAAKEGVGTANISYSVDDDAVSLVLRLSNKTSTGGSGGGGLGGDNDDNNGSRLKVSLGGYHSAVITETGDLYLWGNNYFGQLGDGTTDRKLVPTKIMSSVKAVSLCAYCNRNAHSAAITENGDLYMWGLNSFGQLGDGLCAYSRTIPTKIMSNVKAVSLGDIHSAAITENGDLYMWGLNSSGQLGDGTTDEKYIPTKIMSNVKAVSLGKRHSAAITENGDLYMWGYNYYGQLGDGTTDDKHTPTKIMSNVKAVSLGKRHSAAITENGDLYIWGYNYYGQLGDGTTYGGRVPRKIMSNVKAVSLGGDHSAAITETGDLYMWGDNRCVQLGDGTTEHKYIPTKIMSNVIAVSLGYCHSAAITETGDLYLWGNNYYGQLGDGTTEDKLTPTKFSIPPATKSVSEVISGKKPLPVPIGAGVLNFSGLLPNETYNLYAMKSKDVEAPLSSDNLLYINQVVSDGNGKLSVNYLPVEEYDGCVSFVVPMNQTDISSATVKTDDLRYTGEKQYIKPSVTLGGIKLVEGVDYMLCGDFSATAPGKYTVTVKGIGMYKGEIELSYNVLGLLGDVDQNGAITIADAILVQKHIVNIIKLDDYDAMIADVDMNGKITVSDAILIQKNVAGIINLNAA